jgi:hypothetical protein
MMNRKLVCSLLLLGAAQMADAAPTLPLPPPGTLAQPGDPARPGNLALPTGPSRPIGAIVVNGDIQSRLLAGRGELHLNGRISGHLRVPDPKRQPNVVEVHGLNVAYFGVPQEAITGLKPRGKATGVLGFAADPEKAQYLKYDPQTGMVYGTVAGQIDMPQFAELVAPAGDEKGDDFRTRTQRATLRVQFVMDDKTNLYDKREGVQKRRSEMDMEIVTTPDYDLRAGDYRIAVERIPLDLEIGWFPVIEVAQRLCVQPVRIGQIQISGFPPVFQFKLSGAGLAFGKPGAITQWNKADVVFEWRDWMTVWNASYMAFSESESAALRAEVDVDDCVEVFFVDTFTPSVFWGGGATYSGGTAAAKIISTDQNVTSGVDLTHLAHELGHGLSLKHPGSGTAKDGSTGTLMCPSGFNNDNPKVNSQQNKDRASNPLLTFAIKIVTAGPDCTNNADCGACP